MSADFSNFDPYASYNGNGTFSAGNAKATYSFNAESFTQNVKEAQRAQERIKTHCYPVKEIAGCDIEQQLQKALAESQYWQDCVVKDNRRWQNKYDIAYAEIQAMKEAHKLHIADYETTIKFWQNSCFDSDQEINDLQADYASDHVLWCALENEGYGFDQDRIEELETTIRVLSGMIDS